MGIFDNATQVMIGNKEVQSIKLTSNNAVLYQKGGDNYLLTLTSDKSILSYYDSESATLTATLTNNGSPVSGEKVYFYDGTTSQSTYTGWELVQDEILPGNWFIQIDSDSVSECISIGETSGTTYYYLWYGNGVAYIFDQSETLITSLQASDGLGLIGDILYGDSGTLDISQYNINTSYLYSASDVTLEYTSFIGVDVTDSDGEATASYVSKGSGDLYIHAEAPERSLVSETYTIEDCQYFNDGSRVSDLEIDSGVSCTTNGNYITITKSTSGEKFVRIPVTINRDWVYSIEVAEIGSGQYATFVFNSNYWGAISQDNYVTISLNDSSTNYTHNPSVGDILKIQYLNGVITTYINDTPLKTKTVSISNTKHGFFTNGGRVQNIKNIKLKAL